MGWTTKEKKLEFKKIPSTPEQKQARALQVDLMNRKLRFPTQQFADLTPEEQMIQDSLPDYFAQANANSDASQGYYNDVLSGKYDPLTSKYYQGLRTNSEARTKENVQNARRAGQNSGMLKSGPTDAIAGEQRRLGNANLDITEGQLIESERNRMQGAAGALPGVNASRLNTMAGISNLAAKKRAIQNARNQAAFQTAIQDMLAPYIYNSSIAQALLSEQRYVGVTTGGGLTTFGEIMSLVGSVGGENMSKGMQGIGGMMGGGQGQQGGGAGGNSQAGGQMSQSDIDLGNQYGG